MNRYSASFIVTCLNKNKELYSHGYKRTESRLKNEVILLPSNESGSIDFNFMTNEIGYIAIYSSQGNNPQLLRTEDGGESWEAVIFDEVPEYFSQAYAPEIRDGKPVLYVGMEEYSKMKGEKAYYESSDNGKSWELKKRVFRE